MRFFYMRRIVLFVLLFGGILMGFRHTSSQAPPEFEVPEGFAIEEVYSAEEAGTVVAMTFDSQGRLVISREDSSIFRLVDTDGDGAIDEEQLVTDQVTNSQGLLFDGQDLLAVGDGPNPDEEVVDAGLYRVTDEDGDGTGDEVEPVTLAVSVMQEHGPHNIFYGPDGYLYWSLGNHTAIQPSVAPLSPLNEYDEAVLALDRTDARGHAAHIRAPGGTFVRKNLEDESSQWERVVGGFRNQYDGAFNIMGELFTFDSDMEWDRDLPWFRPTRSVHAVPGGDYGWRTGSRKLPAYYIDTLPPMKDQGRGSPTGVVFYQSYSYPEEYRGMLLQADWSRGRILMSNVIRDGATYRQVRSGNFVYGQPLNVTDIQVGPDGNVYFSLGGRDTQGGIYRVVYEGDDAVERPEADTPVERALTMPQPRAAYSRQAIRDIKEEMGGATWEQELTDVIENEQADPERRVRAMELLHVYGPGLEVDMLTSLNDDEAWEVRAASTYYLGMHETDAVRRELAESLQDEDPFVQRRAAEALVRTGIHPAMDVPFSAVEDVFPLLGSEDRFVRYAARQVLQRINRNAWREAAMQADEYPQAAEALMAYVETIDDPNVFLVQDLLERETELLEESPSNDELLKLIRVIERTMLEDEGVEFAGGGDDPGEYDRISSMLIERFPTADSSLNREIARVFAYLKPEEAVSELAAELEDSDISRKQQIFYAYALSNIDVGWDEEAVDQLASWFEKVHSEGWRGGASFSGYIDYMRQDFVANLPEEYRPDVEDRFEAMEEQQVASLPAGAPAESPHNLSDQELAEELIYDPQSFDGDPSKGAAAYQQALCSSCHTFGPLGREFGPDLTTVGQRFSRSDLVEAIMNPSATISDLWAAQQITRENGETITGTIYNETSDEVVVQIAGGGRVTIPKSDIASRSESSKSPMPEGLHHYLERDELVNLLLFLEAGTEAIPDSMRTQSQ